jgi:U3 small nucleolar RNA-associated protein 20
MEERVGQQLSLHGLMRRMARLADDRTYPRQRARLTALRFLAAVTTRLGDQKIEPFLPLMLRPLFRITEGLSPNSTEVFSPPHLSPLCWHLATLSPPLF